MDKLRMIVFAASMRGRAGSFLSNHSLSGCHSGSEVGGRCAMVCMSVQGWFGVATVVYTCVWGKGSRAPSGIVCGGIGRVCVHGGEGRGSVCAGEEWQEGGTSLRPW